jgi:hypothetical protein
MGVNNLNSRKYKNAYMSPHWDNERRQVCNKVARKYSPEPNSPSRLDGTNYNQSPPTNVTNTDDHTKSTISSMTTSKDKVMSQQVTVVNVTQNIHLRKVVLPSKTKVTKIVLGPKTKQKLIEN